MNVAENEQLKLENQLCFPLYACSKEIVRRYKPFLDPLDLTYTQYIAMVIMWEKQVITVTELGDCLFLDSGTITPVLKKLESKGYIVRERQKDDGRIVTVTITLKGEELKEKAKNIPSCVGKCVKLDAKDCLQLRQLLQKLMNTIEQKSE
jgi:MarR family transcriptional regulator, organic hydroperoxide resistance regulator